MAYNANTEISFTIKYMAKLVVMARGQITILPLQEYQYLDYNSGNIHQKKMGIGGGANQLRIQRPGN
jgi:hypothetical protein